MSKPIPTVQRYMTTAPHSIAVNRTLVQARTMLQELGIRHLPVLDGSRLVGLVTDRDLRLVESLRELDPRSIKVEDAMVPNLYSVSPDTPLDEVVEAMAEQKFGSVVIMQNNKVVGILTTVDVCRAFADMLRGRLSK